MIQLLFLAKQQYQNVRTFLNNITSAHTLQNASSTLDSCQVSSALSLTLTPGSVDKCFTNTRKILLGAFEREPIISYSMMTKDKQILFKIEELAQTMKLVQGKIRQEIWSPRAPRITRLVSAFC